MQGERNNSALLGKPAVAPGESMLTALKSKKRMVNRSTVTESLKAVTWFVLIVFAGAVLFLTVTAIQNRQIAFDQSIWTRAARTSRIDIRYRMVDDLKQRLQQMDTPTLERITQMLGPPDGGGPESPVRVYFLGRKRYGPIGHGYYLRLSFDEKQELIEISVVPD